jgi:hypothetical protein
VVERVDLADRQLRLLPEPVGRIRGLLALDVSRNQLKVRDSYLSFASRALTLTNFLNELLTLVEWRQYNIVVIEMHYLLHIARNSCFCGIKLIL